jgi:DNA-binding transcriptional LysR family regulator
MLRNRFVTVARRGHPKIGAALDLETFLALDHLIVSAAGDFVGAVDRALEPMGLKRRVVAAMPQFLATFATVAETDLIVTVPAGLAADHAERFGLAVYELPLAMDPINVVILAAPGPVPDRGVAWLLDTMADASGCMLEAKVVGTG